MDNYSDTTEQVFRQSLEDLDGDLPPDLHTRLQALFASGSLQDPEQLKAAIRDFLNSKAEETQ